MSDKGPGAGNGGKLGASKGRKTGPSNVGGSGGIIIGNITPSNVGNTSPGKVGRLGPSKDRGLGVPGPPGPPVRSVSSHTTQTDTRGPVIPVTPVPPDATQTDNGPLPVETSAVPRDSTEVKTTATTINTTGTPFTFTSRVIFTRPATSTSAGATDAPGSSLTSMSQVTLTRPVTSTSSTATMTGRTTQAQTDATGPSKATIGGITGGAATIILALVAFCAFRRTRREPRAFIIPMPNFKASDTTGPWRSQGPRLIEAPGPFIPHPFLSLTSEPQGKVSAVKRKEKEKIQSLPPRPQHNQEDIGNTRDPFQDPGVQSGDPRNALDRVQQLTDQLEVELQQLNNLARSGQLPEAERTRLEEIRLATGITIPLVRSGTGYSTTPPSYYSE
ncbi:hypothetical protein P691DRAFT_786999 [Macrolepiota fuliginosa MF-IS2]|uniref:Uncharacterized protein n=1 Tax=Macrolepiota fuliginosa MF-IS2 TaxID=1400762 RepID=A0A9P6BYG7_9AGAR|nr:hypothetical protein P691DRAFT_786999 [Macrolepiota fuliginosa MF-IS2]